MASDLDEAAIKKFVNNVFETSDNVGSLSVKSVREQFLEHTGLESLGQEQKAFFKKTVHKLYMLHTEKGHRESQGSSVGESESSTQSETQSEEDEDVQTSPLSINGRNKRKCRRGSEEDSPRKSPAKSSVPDKEEISDNHSSFKKGTGKKETLSTKTATEQSDSELDPSDSDSDVGGGQKEAMKKKNIVNKLNSNGHKLDDSIKQVNGRKSKSKETTASKGKKRSSPPSEDSGKLKNLKRYTRSCGLRMNYVKLFAECQSMSQKERALDKELRKKTAFEGRITLKMCKKFKKVKEEADEVAELDTNNIISEDGGRPRRRRVGSDDQPPITTPSAPDCSSLFSRLKGVVNSDDSESEEEGARQEHAASHSSDEDSVQHNKKRRKLESSSEDD